VKNALVDSGPLVALFDRDDRDHRRVRDFLARHRLRLVTTWLVLTEVCALLPRRAVLDFLEYVARGGVGVESLAEADIPGLLALSRKYADRPMDFADASLVMLAMKIGLDAILSLDADFAVYRLPGKKPFKNLLALSRK
jgi:predicted nucleic acid-binding protein